MSFVPWQKGELERMQKWINENPDERVSPSHPHPTLSQYYPTYKTRRIYACWWTTRKQMGLPTAFPNPKWLPRFRVTLERVQPEPEQPECAEPYDYAKFLNDMLNAKVSELVALRISEHEQVESSICSELEEIKKKIRDVVKATDIKSLATKLAELRKMID